MFPAGLFDTAASQSEVCMELSRAMAMSEHGIHAILLVFTTSARFTAEEVACLNYLRSAYGGQLLRHCILVFTHGDSLEEEETPLDEFLRNCPEPLQVHRDSALHVSPRSTCQEAHIAHLHVPKTCGTIKRGCRAKCKLLPCIFGGPSSACNRNYTAGILLSVKRKATHHLMAICRLWPLVPIVSNLACLQAVLDEVAGRQVAVNNRAGRSSGQVEALVAHVDALLASNGDTLFTPSCEPATEIQPIRYLACSFVQLT